MKAKLAVTDGLIFELEESNPKDMFGAMATIQEVFGEPGCGMCGSTHIRYCIRKAGDNKEFTYYLLKCYECFAQLEFGQNKDDSNLFPKRQKENGDWDTDHRGWFKYWLRDSYEGDKPKQAESKPKPPQRTQGNSHPKAAAEEVAAETQDSEIPF